MTKWICVVFDAGPRAEEIGVVKTHTMPEVFYNEIVGEYLAQGHPLHPGGGAFVNPSQITEWGFDLGGMAIMGRPFEVFDVDGLAFSLPSEEIERFYNYWTRKSDDERIRYTPVSRRPYVKLKATGCLVVTPESYTRLIEHMRLRMPAAYQRSEEFMLEWTKKTKPTNHPGIAPELIERMNSRRRGN